MNLHWDWVWSKVVIANVGNSFNQVALALTAITITGRCNTFYCIYYGKYSFENKIKSEFKYFEKNFGNLKILIFHLML